MLRKPRWKILSSTQVSESSIIYKLFCGIAEAEHCDDMLNPASDDMVLAQKKISEQIGLYMHNPIC
jgi:hypothetical protein